MYKYITYPDEKVLIQISLPRPPESIHLSYYTCNATHKESPSILVDVYYGETHHALTYMYDFAFIDSSMFVIVLRRKGTLEILL